MQSTVQGRVQARRANIPFRQSNVTFLHFIVPTQISFSLEMRSIEEMSLKDRDINACVASHRFFLHNSEAKVAAKGGMMINIEYLAYSR